MLCQLTVKNLAIVETARVGFTPGLNVVTGETGSGKSVLIGALSLLLGERADKSAIRSGSAEATVEACFELADSRAVDAALEAAGLPPCEDGQLIVRRTLSTTGAGRNWINDSATTLQTLRSVSEPLVDMPRLRPSIAPLPRLPARTPRRLWPLRHCTHRLPRGLPGLARSAAGA